MKRVDDNICLHKYENRQLPSVSHCPPDAFTVCPLVAFALHVCWLCCFCCLTMCHLSCICHGTHSVARRRSRLPFCHRLWHEARAPLTIFGYCQVALYVARLPGDLLPCPFMVRYALARYQALWTLAPKMLEISWASRLTCDPRLGRNSSSVIFSWPTVLAAYSG